MIGPRVGVVGGVVSGPRVGASRDQLAIAAYPRSALELAQALGGRGSWTAGWLADTASGNATKLFGSVDLSAVSTPLYAQPGPFGRGDLGVVFDSAADAFSGGDNFNPGANDLATLLIGSFSSATPGLGPLVSKWNVTPRWLTWINGSNQIEWLITDGVTAKSAIATGIPVGAVAILSVLERGSVQRSGVGVRSFAGVSYTGALVDCTAVGSLTNVNDFRWGCSQDATPAPTTFTAKALYVASGASAAASLANNLDAAVTSLVAYVTR